MSTLGFPLFPEQASTMAPRVDALYFFLIGVSVFFATLILILIIVFAVKYRRRSDDEQPRAISGNLRLEILWTVVPLGLTLVMFGWGAHLFFDTSISAERRSRDQRRRQAMDVENSASRRPLGNQRAACAGGAADQTAA